MALLKIAELAESLKVSEVTVYRLMKKGMPVVKVANSTRYDYEDVVEWLKEQNKERGPQ